MDWGIAKSIRTVLRKLAAVLLRVGDLVYQSEFDKTIEKWNRDNGDTELRLNYEDVDETSLVIDLGGYKGQWASDIFSMYQCQIYVFEPVEGFYSNIVARFRQNEKIRVFPFGLASKSDTATIALGADGSSMFKPGETIDINLVEAFAFFQQNHIEEVALLKMNIEGAEYDLLEHMLDHGLIKKIRNIQIQFHNFAPNAQSRMQAIQHRLSETHTPTYQYGFVWENWRRK